MIAATTGIPLDNQLDASVFTFLVFVLFTVELYFAVTRGMDDCDRWGVAAVIAGVVLVGVARSLEPGSRNMQEAITISQSDRIAQRARVQQSRSEIVELLGEASLTLGVVLVLGKLTLRAYDGGWLRIGRDTLGQNFGHEKSQKDAKRESTTKNIKGTE